MEVTVKDIDDSSTKGQSPGKAAPTPEVWRKLEGATCRLEDKGKARSLSGPFAFSLEFWSLLGSKSLSALEATSRT